jgi:hypothetical protein
MGADGSLLVLVFALCGAGALAGIVVPERRDPALLAWAGSLAALAALWVSAEVLRSGRVFKGELWTIQPLGTLTVSLDRLSAHGFDIQTGRSPPGALHGNAPVPAQLRKKPCNMRLSAVALALRAAV